MSDFVSELARLIEVYKNHGLTTTEAIQHAEIQLRESEERKLQQALQERQLQAQRESEERQLQAQRESDERQLKMQLEIKKLSINEHKGLFFIFATSYYNHNVIKSCLGD